MGFQGAEIHVFPNEAMFEEGGKGKRGGVAVASKEIRSLGRDSKRVVMPRREGYCGYTASSCTRLPWWWKLVQGVPPLTTGGPGAR